MHQFLAVALLLLPYSPSGSDDLPSPGIPESPSNNGAEDAPSNFPAPDFEVDSDGGDGTIGVGIVLPAGAGSSGSGNTSKPRCTWEKVLAGDFRDIPGVIPGEGARSTDQVAELGPDGEVLRLGWWKICGSAAPQFVWVAPTVDIQVLIDGAAARARAATPSPVPNINPAPEAGSFVNLGLWLAIDDPGVTTARVDLGGQWAQVRAVLAGFEVDFGNGDVVACEALGTPIVDVDTVEEGPCGYTYRLSSPEDAPYRVTITSTYNVTYTTSAGRSGALGGLSRSTSFDYDIDEVQTVGVSN